MRLITYPEFNCRLNNLLVDAVKLALASKDMMFYDKEKAEFIYPGNNRKFESKLRKSDVVEFSSYACDVITIFKLFKDKIIQINGDHQEWMLRCIPALESITSDEIVQLVDEIERCSSQWHARLLAGKYDDK